MLSVKNPDTFILEYYSNIYKLNELEQPKRKVKRKYSLLTQVIESIGIVLFFVLICVNG